MKFRRKPTEIEAEQLTRDRIEAYLFDGKPLPNGVTLATASYHPTNRTIDHATFKVTTIHGEDARIVEGDWIMPEPDGLHFYPCKQDIFEATYEPVSGESR